MLTLEQYAAVYLPMIMATGNAQQEEEICQAQGFTVAQWQEAKDFYTAKMADINDLGKTAMAFSAAMMKGATPPAQQVQEIPLPGNFTANKVAIYATEYDVEMIEFLTDKPYQYLIIQMVTEADDAQKGFGGDTYHLCFNEQSYSIYGGLAKLSLNRNQAEFIFDKEGKDRMKCDRITIQFSIDENQYALLLRKMKWIFSDVMELGADANRIEQNVDGVVYSEEIKTFSINDNMKIDIRPKMEQVKNMGKYNFVFFVDYNYDAAKSIQEQQAQQQQMMNKLIPMYEQDKSAYFAFVTHTTKQSRMYIYLSISPDVAINRLNTALYRMPGMPIDLGGGEDATWVNYTQCLADFKEN